MPGSEIDDVPVHRAVAFSFRLTSQNEQGTTIIILYYNLSTYQLSPYYENDDDEDGDV